MIHGSGVPIAASVTPNKTKFSPLLFAGAVDEALSALAALGYQGIELSLRTKDDMDVGAFAKRLDAHRLRLFSIATGQSYIEDKLSLFAADEAVRESTVRRLKDHMDLAADFGACVIIGGIRGRIENNSVAQLEKGERAIDRCIEYAERKKNHSLARTHQSLRDKCLQHAGRRAAFHGPPIVELRAPVAGYVPHEYRRSEHALFARSEQELDRGNPLRRQQPACAGDGAYRLFRDFG